MLCSLVKVYGILEKCTVSTYMGEEYTKQDAASTQQEAGRLEASCWVLADKSSTFLQNIGKHLLDYTASHPEVGTLPEHMVCTRNSTETCVSRKHQY
jgi:hypothetical protein